MNRTDALLALSQGHCVKFNNGDIRKVIDDKVKCWYGPREKWSETERDINSWQLPAETVPNPELSKDAKIEIDSSREQLIIKALWKMYGAIATIPVGSFGDNGISLSCRQRELKEVMRELDKKGMI